MDQKNKPKETRAAASVSHGPRNTDPVKHSSSSPPSQTHGPKVKAGGSPKKSDLKKANSEAMRESDSTGFKTKSQEKGFTWPTTIQEFGYEFRGGELKDIETGGPFKFAVEDNHSYNQARYEALGEAITEEVYRLLETEGSLKKMQIPLDKDAKKGDPRSFIFVSDDVSKNKEKMLVLIHGSGVVRAGQWTRKLIINNSLRHGTQLPFIDFARKHGYSVVVMNTNLNTATTAKGKEKKIPKSSNPEEHAKYVWKHVISSARVKKIAIVAHSYGGVCTVELAREFPRDFLDRVFAIAFTDSVHYMGLRSSPKTEVMRLFEQIAINWVASPLQLDTPLAKPPKDARKVSAGHKQHEWTTYASLESIFQFLEDMDQRGETKIGLKSATETDVDTGQDAMSWQSDQDNDVHMSSPESPRHDHCSTLPPTADNKNQECAAQQQATSMINHDEMTSMDFKNQDGSCPRESVVAINKIEQQTDNLQTGMPEAGQGDFMVERAHQKEVEDSVVEEKGVDEPAAVETLPTDPTSSEQSVNKGNKSSERKETAV